MIIKSYEIEKKISNLIKLNLILLYGENNGLKKDIREIIIRNFKKGKDDIEFLSFYEDEILQSEENLHNAIFSGSLFSNKKIITINNTTDKMMKQIEKIIHKGPKNVLLIIFSQILEKKSKLRNLFEKQDNTICVPCYLDSEKDLENITYKELKKNNINLSREIINLIVDKSNQDRENLKNELEKIKSFSYNKKNIEIDQIKSLINFSGEYKSDNLINEYNNVKLANNSDASYSLRNISRYNFYSDVDVFTINPHGEKILDIKTGEKKRKFSMQFEVLNALTAPATHPVITILIKPKF